MAVGCKSACWPTLHLPNSPPDSERQTQMLLQSSSWPKHCRGRALKTGVMGLLMCL